MKSKATILTQGSDIVASKCLESQKKRGGGGVGGGWELMTLSKKRTLLKDWYKYVLPNSVVKVNGQSMYSVLLKEQRKVFQSSVPERSSWHHL